MISKMSTAPERAFKEKATKLLILQPLRTNYFWTFQCETPCNNYMIYWNFLTQVHCGTIALSDSLGTDYKIPKTANTFFTSHIKIYENF